MATTSAPRHLTRTEDGEKAHLAYGRDMNGEGFGPRPYSAATIDQMREAWKRHRVAILERWAFDTPSEEHLPWALMVFERGESPNEFAPYLTVDQYGNYSFADGSVCRR